MFKKLIKKLNYLTFFGGTKFRGEVCVELLMLEARMVVHFSTCKRLITDTVAESDLRRST